MKSRHLIAAAIAALSLAAANPAQAATLVVPAAGTGPGANASQWQSELTLHTAAPRAVSVLVSFHQGSTSFPPVALTLQARETISIADIVRTKFNVTGGTGALTIEVSDRDARTLAVASRTFNVSPTGEFGQDIPAVDANAALRAGDIAALSGPSTVGENRFNFGVYAVEAANVEWQLVRANGSVAATKTMTYLAGEHAQYNSGVRSLLGGTPADNDTVHARVTTGRAIFYGSVVNATGDPTFVPGVRTRDDILIQLTGVDLDENGSIDIRDNDGDGVLDAPVDIATSLFASYFQVVAAGEFGENVQFEIVSSPAETHLLDNNGTLLVAAGGDLKGKTGEIVLRVTSGTSSSLITIPLSFR
jgi:hypothetical protein